MSSDNPAIVSPLASPFAFQPPAGGDLTLRSCDGIRFQVHSLLLGLASKVFSDMLTGATKSNTVELAQDAETISLMLAFIYPADPPSITTVDQLEKIMESAQKYDIERMIKFVEGCNRPDNPLILSNPVRLFRASIKHNFPTIRVLSAKGFSIKHYDYRSPQGLEEFARLFPESSWVIGLIGAQLVRDEIFKDLPNRDEIKPKHRDTAYDSHSNYMICDSCWNKRRLFTGDVYTPGWMFYWIQQLHQRHINNPLDPCEDLLSIAFVIDAKGCSACNKQTLTKRSEFEDWARTAKKTIDEELKVLEKLYSL